MLKLTIYKNVYTLSIIGGNGNVLKEKRSDHFSTCWYYVYSSLCYKISIFFWEATGYKLKYKGQVYTFENLNRLSEFVANETLKAG